MHKKNEINGRHTGKWYCSNPNTLCLKLWNEVNENNCAFNVTGWLYSLPYPNFVILCVMTFRLQFLISNSEDKVCLLSPQLNVRFSAVDPVIKHETNAISTTNEHPNFPLLVFSFFYFFNCIFLLNFPLYLVYKFQPYLKFFSSPQVS